MSASSIVRAGNVRLRVVPNPKILRGRRFTDWEFRWRDGTGRRRRIKRARKKDALAEARKIATDLAAGRSAELSSADVASFRAGIVNLWGCGTTIEAATAEYAEARRRLAGAGSILEAADFYARHHTGGGSDKAIADVVAELIQARRAAGAGHLHLKDLKERLGKFAAGVNCPIRQISAPMINQWLKSLKLGPRSLKNYRGAVSNLVEFAIGEKYLPATFAEMRFVPIPKEAGGPVEIFTIAEMRLLLRHCTPSLLPVLVLGGFAGLRTSETRHIRWEHIHWGQECITVPKGKTGSRLAQLTSNAEDWLLWLRDSRPAWSDERVVRLAPSSISNSMARAAQNARKDLPRDKSLEWIQNGLRHSFVTYWASFEHDLCKISERTGHSVQTLKKRYQRKDVLPEKGRAWFEIRPESRQLVMFNPDGKICPLFAPSHHKATQNGP